MNRAVYNTSEQNGGSMMLLTVEAMTYSDVLLLQYLKTCAPVGDEFTLAQTEAAQDTGISFATVRRAMLRLETAGLISRRPGFANLYVYRVNQHGNRSEHRESA